MGRAAFADHLYGLGLHPRTVDYYVRDIELAERWLIVHDADLETVTARLLAEYATTLTFSHSTRGRVAAAVSHYWEFIERPRPPARAIRVPPAPEYACRALEEDEARALAKTAIGWWPQGGTVLLGLYLGLRRFEIAKAEWSRFDNELTWYTVIGKRDKTKTLPVHPVVTADFIDHRGAGWVFPGRLRGSANPATVWQWIMEVAAAAGVANVTPHRLRHTCLATANDRTGDLRAVQDFARHAKPSTTSIYTRTKQRRLREISDSLDYL